MDGLDFQKLLVFVALFVALVPDMVLNVPPKDGSFQGNLLKGFVGTQDLLRAVVHAVVLFFVLRQVKKYQY